MPEGLDLEVELCWNLLEGPFLAVGILEKSKVLRLLSWSTFFTWARLSWGTPGALFRSPGAAPGVTWGLLLESPWQRSWLAPEPVLGQPLAG